jgi:hypothetical protein
MRAVRDADPKPPAAQLRVLWALALRMSVDGAGYASERQLADDAGAGGRTVRNAVRWAIGAGYLNRTRREYRLSDGGPP